jgi:putative copper resistance protein D
MAFRYIDSLGALYATAYGLMISAKAAMLGVLLCLGALNYARVERLRREPGTSPLRLRRIAEAELGIGLAVVFAAASITSAPPSVDVVAADRPSWSQVVERMTPRSPDLSGPYFVELSTGARHTIPLAEAARLNAEAVTRLASGGTAPAYDIAWSEFNHHWSGVFVTALGLLALAHRTGRAPWARHWPLLFVGLAIGIFLIADPEYWPVGPLPFLDGFLSAEVLQHRLVFFVVAAFGGFEWAVRAGRLNGAGPAHVFPLATGLGGALLLLHSHSVADVREELLIEWTHVPLALLGLFAGAARWLELRLAPEDRRIPSLIWPACFVLVGLLLLFYREYD